MKVYSGRRRDGAPDSVVFVEVSPKALKDSRQKRGAPSEINNPFMASMPLKRRRLASITTSPYPNEENVTIEK